MPPSQIHTGQGRPAGAVGECCDRYFGVAPGSAAADATAATVDKDDQDDEAVLVAVQQKQQKEKIQPVLFTEDHMYTYTHSHSLSFPRSPSFSVTHSPSRVLSLFSSVSFSRMSLD